MLEEKERVILEQQTQNHHLKHQVDSLNFLLFKQIGKNRSISAKNQNIVAFVNGLKGQLEAFVEENNEGTGKGSLCETTPPEAPDYENECIICMKDFKEDILNPE